MDWQWVAAAGCLVAAAGYLMRQAWRTWSGGKSGCAGCSCANKSESAQRDVAVRIIPQSELLSRLRRH